MSLQVETFFSTQEITRTTKKKINWQCTTSIDFGTRRGYNCLNNRESKSIWYHHAPVRCRCERKEEASALAYGLSWRSFVQKCDVGLTTDMAVAHFRTLSMHFAVKARLEKEPRLCNHSFFTHYDGERIECCGSNAKVLYSTNS